MMKLKHVAFIVSAIVFGLILLVLLRSSAEGLENQTSEATPDNSTAIMGAAAGAKMAAKLGPGAGSAPGPAPALQGTAPTAISLDPKGPPGAGPPRMAMGPPVFVQSTPGTVPADKMRAADLPMPTGTPMPFSMAADPGIVHRPTAAAATIMIPSVATLQAIYFVIHGEFYGTLGTLSPTTSILQINKKALDQYPELAMIDKSITLLLSQAAANKPIDAKEYSLKVGSITSNAKSLTYKSASTAQLKDQFKQIQELTTKIV